MSKSSAAQKAAKAAYYIKALIELITNLASQNYAGAAWAAVKLLPLIIVIIIFLIIAPLIIFLYLPSLLIDHLNPFTSNNTDISGTYVQDNVLDLYNTYSIQFDDYIKSIEDKFNDGDIDPEMTYSSYGRNPSFDITRETARNGSQVDTFWLATLLSVYTMNEPDSLTPETTNSLIHTLLTYNVSEEITKVNRNQNPTNLEITRTLNLNFKNPADIMDVLGFDEQQKMWAEFMYSAITWDSESGDYEAYIPGVDLVSPIAANWRSAVTSEFGWRTDPFTGERSFHNGIDIEKPRGTDIMAVMAGTVSYVHFGTTGYGYVVRIDHGGGIETLYSHCSAIHVTEGQEVKQGEVIAAVGNTGRSTGPHLHFELRINGRAVNPRPHLP